MIHSKNGMSAIIASGTSGSVICQSPKTIRMVSAETSVAAITHGDGWFQNSRQASESVKPLRTVRAVKLVIVHPPDW
ncbi:MAG: hypothetical protein JWR37_2836 [Mycobacterium sp.]|jgi:hypothetical protein|nr:hypothetical protein [Mycobacterium sp.]